jgi:hypothetical protein
MLQSSVVGGLKLGNSEESKRIIGLSRDHELCPAGVCNSRARGPTTTTVVYYELQNSCRELRILPSTESPRVLYYDFQNK